MKRYNNKKISRSFLDIKYQKPSMTLFIHKARIGHRSDTDVTAVHTVVCAGITIHGPPKVTGLPRPLSPRTVKSATDCAAHKLVVWLLYHIAYPMMFI